jgi:CRISPR-associated protein Cas5t
MKAIKIIGYQPVASYRKPVNMNVRESYPLPPYSTVIGMVHAACGFDKYVDMNVSIQGHVDSHSFDINNEFAFKPGFKYEEARHQVMYKDGDKTCGITRTLTTLEQLVGIALVIHVAPKDDSMLEAILDGMKHPKTFLTLGRKSDMLRIDRVSVVDVTELGEDDSHTGFLPCDAYLPVTEKVRESSKDIFGTIFNLGKKYAVTPKGLRFWEESVDAMFAAGGSQGYISATDNEGTPVFLA